MTRLQLSTGTKTVLLTAIFLLGVGLSACIPVQEYNKTKKDVQGVQAQVQADEQQAYPRPPTVVEKDDAYVDTTPIPLSTTPAWMKQPVSMHGTNLPFSFYVAQTLANTGVVNQYDNTVDKNKTISIDFSGSTKTALNNLEGVTGYHYTFDKDNNMITWSQYETKVFDISFMPGDSQYQLGQESGALTLSGAGSVSANANGSTAGGYDFAKDNQFSKLTGTISVWKDLESTVKSLLSKDGTATVSQSTTTITVHDKPSNVDAVGVYLNTMNRELSRQVRIHVQLLEVRLNANYNYGIDWDIVRRIGKEKISLTSAGAVNAGNTGTFTPIAFAWGASNPQSLWYQSNSIIQSLEQQGDVSLITQPTVTTLNNQVATISLQNQENYINSTTSTVGAGGTDFAQGGVNTATITTGLNLYLLPKVQNQKVFLQISSVLSDLQSLQTINTTTGNTVPSNQDQNALTQDQGADNIIPATEIRNNDGTTSSVTTATQVGNTTVTASETNGNQALATPQIVQLPEVALRSFNQRSVIPNGATLILAGFIQNGNQANQNKVFDIAPVGGSGATRRNIELVMLITPVILGDNENDLGSQGYQNESPGGMG